MRCCLLLLWAVVCTAVRGQEEKDSIDFTFRGVTITATRIPEPLYEVPMAISVIDQERFLDQRGIGLEGALGGVPGVLVQSRAGSPDVRIAIRGYGARGAGDRSNAGTTRGIRVITDGLPDTEPDGRTSMDFADPNLIEGIEIVRSNASSVWGNAGGGVLNIRTVPEFDTSFTLFSAKGGSFGYRDVSLRQGVPLGTGRFVGSVSRSTFDGWRENSRSDRTLLSLTSRILLAEKTNLGLILGATENRFAIPGPLTERQYDSSSTQANPTYDSRRERRINRLVRFGATLDHEWDEQAVSGAVFVNPKYLQRSERGTYRDFTRYHLGGNLSYRRTFRFGEDTKAIFLIGMDEAVQDGAVLFYSLTSEGERGDQLRADKREGANHMGGFAQNEILLQDKLTLLAGIRYDHVTYFNRDFLNPSLGESKRSFRGWSPKVGVSYRFEQTHSVYASFGTGIEVPAGNETDPVSTFGQDTVYLINPLLKPIRSITVEAGTRRARRMIEGPVALWSYEVALYTIRVTNDIIPYRGGRFYFTAGRTHRTGLEIAGQLSMRWGLDLSGSWTLSRNRYDRYRVDSVHYDAGKANVFADYKGNRLAGVPETFYGFGIKVYPDALKGFYVQLDGQGLGSYCVDDANTTRVPSYVMANVTVGLVRPIRAGRFQVRPYANIQNILNRRYIGSAFINPDVVDGEAVYIEPGLPRQWSIGLSIRM